MGSSPLKFVGKALGLAPKKPKKPRGPAGPPPDLTPEQIAQRKSTLARIGAAPVFLGLSEEMTPLQKRAAIATQGVSGDVGGTDKETLKYYRQLLYDTLVNQQGQLAGPSEILPVEYEYLRRAGVDPRRGSTASFISALERAIR